MLVGEVEEARKHAEVVAMTREEARTQLSKLEARLDGLLEEKGRLKVCCEPGEWSLLQGLIRVQSYNAAACVYDHHV